MTSIVTAGTGVTLTLDTLDGAEVIRENLATNPGMVSAGAPVAYATNVVQNPSFENGITTWSPAGCTATVTSSFSQMTKSGGNIAQCVADNTVVVPSIAVINSSYRPAVTPGQWVGLTAFLATESGYEVRVQINWRDAAGVTISNVASPWLVGSFYTGANPQIVAQAPALTASVGYYLQWRNPADTVSNMISGKRMWADAVFAVVRDTQEEAQFWTNFPYWDGNTTSPDFTFAWTGTAHASSSTIRATTPVGISSSSGTGGVGFNNNVTVSPRNGSHTARWTWTKGSTGGSAGIIYTQTMSGVAGDQISVRASVRSSHSKSLALLVRFRNVTTTVGQNALVYVNLNPGEWYDFLIEGLTATDVYTNVQVYPLISNANTQVSGETLDLDSVLIERGATISGPAYDGSTPANPGVVDYEWEGTANASVSRAVFHVTEPGFQAAGEQPTDLPPRVRVTVSGVTTAGTYKLTRTATGETNTVPGYQAKYLAIGDADIEVDWAAPLNRPIRYNLYRDDVLVASATITLDSRAAILQDPLQPDRFVRVTAQGRSPGWVTMRQGSNGDIRYGSGPNIVPIMGSTYGVSLGGQVSRGSSIPELLSTYGEDQADEFRNMVLGGSPIMLLRPTQDMRKLPPLAYLAGSFSESDVSASIDPANGITHWEITASLVAAVMQAAKSGYVTYDQVQTLLGGLTYDQVQAAYSGLTYLMIQQNPLLYETL